MMPPKKSKAARTAEDEPVEENGEVNEHESDDEEVPYKNIFEETAVEGKRKRVVVVPTEDFASEW